MHRGDAQGVRAREPGKPSEATLGGTDQDSCSSKKRPSPEPAAMVCEGVCPTLCKGKLLGVPSMTKRVPLGDGTSRTITIGAGLSPN
jgi:hypothetical protein